MSSSSGPTQTLPDGRRYTVVRPVEPSELIAAYWDERRMLPPAKDDERLPYSPPLRRR